METPKQQFSTGVGTSLGDTATPSPTAGLKPIADEVRSVPPFGSPKGEGQHDQGETPEESQVVRLIHTKAESVPMPSDMGAGEIVRRSGFRSAWTVRHYRPSSDRQPRLARCV